MIARRITADTDGETFGPFGFGVAGVFYNRGGSSVYLIEDVAAATSTGFELGALESVPFELSRGEVAILKVATGTCRVDVIGCAVAS